MKRLMGAGSSASCAGSLHARPCGENQVVLIITGMGALAARKRCRTALGLGPGNSGLAAHAQPDAVLMTGLCGALSASLDEGAIVVYTEVRSTQPGRPPLQCARGLAERIADLLTSRRVPCELVKGITSSRIAANREEKLRLAQSGASVVDMESYEIASAAMEAGAPAAIVRVVSDTLDALIPDFNGVLTADGRLKTGKAARIAIRHPIQTAALISASRRAIGRAEKALEIVLLSDVFNDLTLNSSQKQGAKP